VSVIDKFRKASSSGRAVVTSLALAKANGANTCSLIAATNWPATVDYVMYRRQLNTTTGKYEEIAGSRIEGRADVSGTTLSNMTIDAGTEPAAGYAADGNTVVMAAATSRWANDLIDGILALLNQDGSLRNASINNSSQFSAGVVNTAALGANSVTTSKIPNGNVTADKLSLGPQTAFVATDQTTTSTTYTDLATTTDQVTVTIGANGAALVGLNIGVYNSGASDTFAGFDISGASTVAASDVQCVRAVTTSAIGLGAAILVTGLNPGSTTFKLKYRVSGGTGHAFNRRIAVVPL
jgi:hypothetical protein